MQALLNNIDNFLGAALNNPYVNAALTLFLVLYAGLAAPNLPPFIAALFESNLFKLLVLFLILAVRNYSTTVALLAALGFLLSLQTLSRYRLFAAASDALGGVLGLGGEAETKSERESESEGEDAAPATAMMGMAAAEGCGGPVACQDLACGQPIGSDAVLPPQDETAVSGVCGCDWQGPQGLRHPQGYPGKVCGAEYEAEMPAGAVLPGA